MALISDSNEPLGRHEILGRFPVGSLQSRAAVKAILEQRKAGKEVLLKTRTRKDIFIVRFPRPVPKPRSLREGELPFVPLPPSEVPYREADGALSRTLVITEGQEREAVLTGAGGFTPAEVGYLSRRQMAACLFSNVVQGRISLANKSEVYTPIPSEYHELATLRAAPACGRAQANSECQLLPRQRP